MGIPVGVVKELYPGERRVALAPQSMAALAKCGVQVLIERDAGRAAGFPDAGSLKSGRFANHRRLRVSAINSQRPAKRELRALSFVQGALARAGGEARRDVGRRLCRLWSAGPRRSAARSRETGYQL